MILNNQLSKYIQSKNKHFFIKFLDDAMHNTYIERERLFTHQTDMIANESENSMNIHWKVVDFIQKIKKIINAIKTKMK